MDRGIEPLRDSHEVETDNLDLVIDLTAPGLEESTPKAAPAREQRATLPPPEVLLHPGVVVPLPPHEPEVAALSRWETFFKRTVDLVIGVLLLVLTLPVQLLIALAIAVDSRGPVIFRQVRVGEGGRLFRFYKFRTMVADAPRRFPDLYRYEYRDDEVEHLYFKYANDPRCTRVGRFIRRTSLDELPNLFNVIRGDMSLVGPRPEIPQMLPYYRREQLSKFAVKPGLTGLAQISGRNVLRFQQTAGFDLDYVRSRSLATDLRILVRTPVVVVRMLGAL